MCHKDRGRRGVWLDVSMLSPRCHNAICGRRQPARCQSTGDPASVTSVSGYRSRPRSADQGAIGLRRIDVTQPLPANRDSASRTGRVRGAPVGLALQQP